MCDRRLSVLLVLLIFSISFSQGQKLKANDRRAAGLVPYPRIGRNSDMTNLPRSDRALGMLQYPRVGRSDLPASNVNANRNRDLETDGDFEFYAPRDIDSDAQLDSDYEVHVSKPFKPKYIEKILKDGALLVPIHNMKEVFYPTQKIIDLRQLVPGNYKDFRNYLRQPKLKSYTPRLGREAEHGAIMGFL